MNESNTGKKGNGGERKGSKIAQTIKVIAQIETALVVLTLSRVLFT